MILHQGNYWDYYNKADLFLFTGNSTVKEDGRLVMGRGTARQVKDKFPGIDLRLGREISELYPPINNKAWKREYLLMVSPKFKTRPEKKIGVFQTKYYWKQNASIKLVEKSCIALIRFMDENPGLNIFLPIPGVGNGNLSYLDVLPMLSLFKGYLANERSNQLQHPLQLQGSEGRRRQKGLYLWNHPSSDLTDCCSALDFEISEW